MNTEIEADRKVRVVYCELSRGKLRVAPPQQEMSHMPGDPVPEALEGRLGLEDWTALLQDLRGNVRPAARKASYAHTCDCAEKSWRPFFPWPYDCVCFSCCLPCWCPRMVAKEWHDKVADDFQAKWRSKFKEPVVQLSHDAEVNFWCCCLPSAAMSLTLEAPDGCPEPPELSPPGSSTAPDAVIIGKGVHGAAPAVIGLEASPAAPGEPFLAFMLCCCCSCCSSAAATAAAGRERGRERDQQQAHPTAVPSVAGAIASV